jgi:hypothetical protein
MNFKKLHLKILQFLQHRIELSPLWLPNVSDIFLQVLNLAVHEWFNYIYHY